MARIPVTSNRPAKNVRNGPSIWQQRLFTLLRETRWAVLLIITVWLSLVLFTWHSSDPGWFSSGDGSPTHNKGGYVGAYVADILYFHFGYSAWLIVLFLVYQLGIGFQRITSIVMPNKTIKEPLPRIPWGLAVGFVLLLMGSMGFESMQTHYGTGLPAGPGGQLGLLLSHLLVLYLGAAITVIILLVAICVGASWLFAFSWLNVAERVGGWVEKGYFYLVGVKHRFDDRQAGRLSIAQRLESMTSKRLKSKVLPTAPKESVVAERKEPSLHAGVVAAEPEPEVAMPPIVTAARQYKNPIFEEPESELEPVIVPEPESEPFIEPESEVLSTHPIQTQTQATVVKAVKAPSEVGLPTLDLLDQAEDLGEFISADTLEFTSRLIEKKLSDFGVNVTVEEALSGPVITRYEIEPATGVKGVQIVNLSKDLARSLSLVDIRVVETIPGKNLMGLELPNPKRQVVRLEEIIGSVDFDEAESLLTVALGKDIAGEAVVADLARMPHLLVAGTTGSGKSVGINAMILSLLYKATPDEVRLILIDPKMLEMSVYEDIPHLLAPVVTDMSEAANALTWCVNEMDRRYKLMSKMGVRNLAGFNSKIDEAAARGESLPNPFSLTPDAPEPLEKLPFIVVIIDELADLMMVAGKKIEELIARLAQKARAAGIHLILATQRPSVDVITGLIKANIPTRISFQVSSRVDSRTVLDQAGAETLLGMGDMLYLPPGTSVPVRVHGAFVADDEVHRVVDYLKAQGEPDYVEGLLEGGAPGETGDGVNPVTGMADAEADPLYDAAVALVLESKRASASWVQRNLSVGYNRAARLVEEMERNGILSPMGSNGRREILVPTNTTEEVN